MWTGRRNDSNCLLFSYTCLLIRFKDIYKVYTHGRWKVYNIFHPPVCTWKRFLCIDFMRIVAILMLIIYIFVEQICYYSLHNTHSYLNEQGHREFYKQQLHQCWVTYIFGRVFKITPETFTSNIYTVELLSGRNDTRKFYHQVKSRRKTMCHPQHCLIMPLRNSWWKMRIC